MRYRLPPFVVLGLLVAICAAAIGMVAVLRARGSATASLLTRLPANDAIVVSIDFRQLRHAGVLGMLASSHVMQEPEYRSFVDQTGFDYLNDLDSALISFHPNGTYLLLRGRFDWKNLKDYSVNQGGSCHNTLCQMNGSTPDRKISYFPLQSNVMALAVSKDPSAAVEMQTKQAPKALDIPQEPVWSMIPVGAMKNSSTLPAGTRAFVHALDGAETVFLSAGLEDSRIALKLDARCRNEADARALVNQLRDLTAQLRDLIARENQAPNPRDLSGVLAAGAFEQKENHALGRWPVERAFLQNLAGSSL